MVSYAAAFAGVTVKTVHHYHLSLSFRRFPSFNEKMVMLVAGNQ
jgi:uncharacterized protein YrrD